MFPKQLLGIGLLVGGAAVFALSATPGHTATNYTLLAGAESADKAIQVNEFGPRSVAINVGDTVTWQLDSTEFHTVNFLAGADVPPFVDVGPMGPFLHPLAAFPLGGATFDGSEMAGSGLLIKGDTYALTFTAPGTYEYVCIIHPDMKAEIVVREGGPVDDPAQVMQRAQQAMLGEIDAHGQPLLQQGPAAGTVVAGDGDGHLDIMRFLPTDISVGVGETVTWVNQEPAGTPHTVTFLAGTETPELVIPAPSEAGPPTLLLNPAVIMPAGDGTFDGSTVANSGMIGNAPMDPTNMFSLTFTAPGTYEYVCLLHEEQGMKGTVTVLP